MSFRAGKQACGNGFVTARTTFPRTLVIEDDPEDAFLLHRAFKDAGISDSVHFVGGGLEALDYLRGKQLSPTSASTTLPSLLLLNLRMPDLSGFEVLEWLQSQPIEDMTVVVLSGSEQREDVQRAMELGADYYHVKQADARKRSELIRLLEQYLERG